MNSTALVATFTLPAHYRWGPSSPSSQPSSLPLLPPAWPAWWGEPAAGCRVGELYHGWPSGCSLPGQGDRRPQRSGQCTPGFFPVWEAPSPGWGAASHSSGCLQEGVTVSAITGLEVLSPVDKRLAQGLSTLKLINSVVLQRILSSSSYCNAFNKQKHNCMWCALK